MGINPWGLKSNAIWQTGIMLVFFFRFLLQLRTDNGPVYTSKRFKEACSLWNINHITGILYNPQGQAFVKWQDQTIKLQISKIKKLYTPT